MIFYHFIYGVWFVSINDVHTHWKEYKLLIFHFSTWYQSTRYSKFSSFISRFFLLFANSIFAGCQQNHPTTLKPQISNDKVPEKSLGNLASLSGSDLSSIQIITHKLTGRNYLQWMQSIKIVICGRGKLRYLTGELQALNISDPHTKSGSPRTLLSLPGSSTCWSPISVDVTFGPKQQKRHGRRPEKCILILVTPLRSSNFDPNWRLIQGEKSVTDYFSDLQDIWQELDLFLEDLSPCATCGVKFR